MIDRLSVLCFAGTYGLALLAELARFVVRGAVRWYLAAALMALGWLVQTAFLANVALKNPQVLVTTVFESVMLLSWIVALIGLYLMVRSPRQVAVGMFVLPLGAGSGDRRGLVRAAGVGLARLGRHDRVLGNRARDFPAGRRGLHVRGVLRRADVPGPDAAAQGQTAVPIRPGAAQSRAIRADQPGVDHDRFPPLDVRAADRGDPEPGGPG